MLSTVLWIKKSDDRDSGEGPIIHLRILRILRSKATLSIIIFHHFLLFLDSSSLDKDERGPKIPPIGDTRGENQRRAHASHIFQTFGKHYFAGFFSAARLWPISITTTAIHKRHWTTHCYERQCPQNCCGKQPPESGSSDVHVPYFPKFQ